MGLNILDRIHQRIELFRLEQRYTRNRNRRSTFVSNATYVDGEYVFNTPNTTGSSSNSSSKNSSTASSPIDAPTAQADEKAAKRLNRWSSMPGFGSMSKASGRDAQRDWRTSNVSVNEVR
ncbi:hypothetical protein GQ53DRAFT_761631 [Thozetella sp. PMI_491]|nr:hypothetical protein GQ53DRAFT_761631 [Thozetella sp. PMI_491]